MIKPKLYPIEELPMLPVLCAEQIWKEAGIRPTPQQIDALVITYHDGIYAKDPLPDDLMVHEMVHFERQGSGEDQAKADEFIKEYARNPVFRFNEELIAFRAQYKYLRKHHSRTDAYREANRFARELSSAIYGNICTFSQALDQIVNGKN